MLVVVNELAGRTGSRAVGEVAAVLREHGDAEVAICRGERDMDRILDSRAGRRVVVVGGDGSLHTMVGALWRRGEAGDCEVALIPLGTGNDFARGAGLPADGPGAARVAATGKPHPTDLFVEQSDGGVVVNAVHVGAGAAAALRAKPLKQRLKVAAFPVGAVLAGVTATGWRLRVTVDGEEISGRKVLMVGLSNGPTIAGGTGALAPGADPADGLADVTVSFAVGPFARVGYALALYRGRHPARADVVQVRGRDVRIDGESFHANADGEVSGPYTGRHWRIRPGAWLFVR